MLVEKSDNLRVTEEGVPVEDLIDAVKNAIKEAAISNADTDRNVKVGSVDLTLHVVAAQSLGGGLEFCVPFVGMKVKLGSKITRQNTHIIDVKLTPSEPPSRPEVRDGDIETALVDAIRSVRAIAVNANTGDDPFVLASSNVELSFAVTEQGTISLGVEGDLTNEVTHHLKLSLLPV